MNAVEIIIKKRDRLRLSKEEIEFFVEGFTAGAIPDYQAAAFAMAIMLNGMTAEETTNLTLAMAASGQVLDLAGVVDIAVDKHSSGGVGDKTSIAVLPMVTACGLPVGKMSGRGLGFSGGTLDKLESIPGFRCDLNTEEFKQQLREHKIVLTGQSLELAPADGKLYALRDVTGTVPSMPLIASSIMCKKIAGGAQAIVLDVKAGRGAFMETPQQAEALAALMMDIGSLAGRQTVALISDMNQPLGHAVGNALEMVEAIETLRGGGPMDFREHCLRVAAHMLVLGRRAETLEVGERLAEAAIANGRALEMLRVLVRAQGGDVSFVDEPARFERARLVEEVASPREGYLAGVDARAIGEAAVSLGAGRVRKEDPIDHSVGLVIHHKVGDRLGAGEPMFAVHANNEATLEKVRETVLRAHTFSDAAVPPLPLFYD